MGLVAFSLDTSFVARVMCLAFRRRVCVLCVLYFVLPPSVLLQHALCALASQAGVASSSCGTLSIANR